MLVSWFQRILRYLESRGYYGCLRCEFYLIKCCQWCTLKSLTFTSLLHLLIGPCSVFYAVCLFFCDVDVQLPHQYFESRQGDLEVFGLTFLAIFVRRLSSILFTRCLHARFLILAHFISWITRMLRILFRRVSPLMHLKVLISIVLSRHLLIVVLMAWIIIGLTLDEIQNMVLWDDEEKKKKELDDFC